MVDADKISEYLEKASVCKESGDFVNAIENYKNVFNYCHEQSILASFTWGWIAEIYQFLEINDIAIECYQNGIYADNTNENNYIELIKLYTELNEWDNALEYTNKYLLVNPKDDFAWSHKGVLLNILDRNSEALRCLKKAEELNPNNPQVLIFKDKGLL